MGRWRDVDRTEISQYCDEHTTIAFKLEALHTFCEDRLTEAFPKNNTHEASLRRTLQELRDEGELVFFGNGRYQLDPRSLDLRRITRDPPRLRGEWRTAYLVCRHRPGWRPSYPVPGVYRPRSR